MKVESGTSDVQIAYALRRSAAMSAPAPLAPASAVDNGSKSAEFANNDFRDMTPREMYDTATKMFRAGDIDLTQLFMLQNMGVPLGRLGTGGEFVPLSDGERDAFRDQSYDYLSGARDAISYLEQSGRASDPTSGYRNWQGILEVLQNRQGTPAGIDLTA